MGRLHLIGTLLGIVVGALSARANADVTARTDPSNNGLTPRAFAAQDDAPLLSVTPAARDVGETAGSTTFDVANDGAGTMNWTASVRETDYWLTIVTGTHGTDGGTFTATFLTNTGANPRTGMIAVSATGARNSPVKVMVVQAGLPSVRVPNVVGKDQGTAEDMIAAAGLVVGVVAQEQSSTIPAGQVMAQDPAADTSVLKGSEVTLDVSEGPASVTVPNVAGMTEVSAQMMIKSAGLAVGTVTTQTSPATPAGQVIGQNPAPGTVVLANSTVDIVISSGLAQAKVPEVVGKPLADAQAAIAAARLTVGAITRKNDAAPLDEVIGQSPTAGILPLGAQVDLVVSDGPAPISVPDLVGKKATDALAALTDLGFRVGRETLTYNDTVLEGVVISQTPAPGAALAPGAAVDLVISEGPAAATGTLTVTIEPEAARTAGAQWRLDGGDWHASDETVDGVTPGPHIVAFSDLGTTQGPVFGCVAGNAWTTPPHQTVTVAPDQATTATGTYAQAKEVAAGPGTKPSGDWALLAAGLLCGAKQRRRQRDRS